MGSKPSDRREPALARSHSPASGAREAFADRARPTRFAARAAKALALLALAACDRRASRDADDTARPLEMLVANDPETLDPRYAIDAVGLRATRMLHAGLVRLDPDTLAPVPALASGWTWIDPLTLRVDLRTDVRFHSGAPLRAADVVATLRAIVTPSVGARQFRVLDAMASAEADGDHAVVVRLARPHATLVTDLEVPILREDQAASPPAPDGTLDGLGPYAVEHVDRGEVRLVPATYSAFARPARAVTLRTVHDETTRALRLESGRADVALNLISPALLPALGSAPGLAVVSRPGANLTYMVVHEPRAPLGDPRVRRALSAAIDRPLLTGTLLAGHAQPAGALIAPASWAHVDSPPFAFDPAGARSLLAEAGVSSAPALHLTLLTSTERLRGDIARVIAQELGELGAGIEVRVVPLELGTLIARLNAGDFDLAILQLPEMTEPNVLRHFLHSAFTPPAGANRGRVHDAELDALLDEGDRVVSIDARRAVYAALEAHERDAMHLIPLWYEDQVAVVSERAKGFVPSAEGRWLSLAWLK